MRQLLQDWIRFPWRPALRTLRERLDEDRLPLSAGSLTFITIIALVPFFTVVLAIFTAFPVFGKLQGALQAWLLHSLVPDAISRQVMGYITQFAGKAAGLGLVGSAVLFATLLTLVMTIDRTLNSIWRVRRPRALGQQVLIYWAAITLGPLVIAASLSISSYVLSASRGLVGGLPSFGLHLLDVFELFLLVLGFAAIYRFVPNTPVRARHAWAGGAFTAIGIELARRLLALYVQAVPTYSAVYGAFATVPILLIWIYLVWLIVLLGAVLTAHLPSLTAGRHRRPDGHGWQFQVALEVLRVLDQARPDGRRGLSMPQISQALQLSDLQIEPVIEALITLGWVGLLNQPDDPADAPYVLLADVQSTALEPLVRLLLLPSTQATERLWQSGRLSTLYLKDAI